jgi:ribosomal protein S20
MKRLLIVASLLVILLTSVSAIYAQDPGDTGRGRPRPQRGQNLIEMSLVREAAAATATRPMQVIQARRNGQSLTDYIIENGADPDAVSSAVLTQITERIQQAVENGRITAEQAEALESRAETAIAEAMTSTEPIFNRRLSRNDNPNRPGLPQLDLQIREILTEATGLTGLEIAQQLRSGTTLAQVIEDSGADVAAVSAQILDKAQARLDEAVSNGRITQEQADELMARAAERLDNLLNREFGQHRLRNRLNPTINTQN